jgi:hypothetical protein
MSRSKGQYSNRGFRIQITTWSICANSDGDKRNLLMVAVPMEQVTQLCMTNQMYAHTLASGSNLCLHTLRVTLNSAHQITAIPAKFLHLQ